MSEAPFIHPLLKTGIEDVNLLIAAIALLRAQLEERANPTCPYLKAKAKKLYANWGKTVRINALLVREVLKRTYKTNEIDAAQDTPSVVYKKTANGHRYPPRPLNLYYFEEKQTFKVYGWVAAKTDITNIPYIDHLGRLMVKENGQWTAMDGDWGPCSKDIKPDGTFFEGSIFRQIQDPVWLRPALQTIAVNLGRREYQRLVNAALSDEWGHKSFL